MARSRNLYKYHFKKGSNIVHIGVTNDLERREQEHQDKYGKDGHIHQVGRRVTRRSALEWERKENNKCK